MARRRSRFIRPAPRTKIWIGAGVGGVSVPSNTKVLVSTLSVGSLLLRPFTVLRTHQVLLWSTDQIAASEGPVAGFGHIVVTEQAAAIGITAIPDPSGQDGDPEADWFVWQGLQTNFEFSTAAGFRDVGKHYVVDSKAMRKVGPDDDLVSVVSSNGGFGAILTVAGRRLIQLH